MTTRLQRLIGALLMAIGLLIVIESKTVIGNMLLVGLLLMPVGLLVAYYEKGDDERVAQVAGWTFIAGGTFFLWIEVPVEDVSVIFLLAGGCFVYLWRDWIKDHLLPSPLR